MSPIEVKQRHALPHWNLGTRYSQILNCELCLYFPNGFSLLLCHVNIISALSLYVLYIWLVMSCRLLARDLLGLRQTEVWVKLGRRVANQPTQAEGTATGSLGWGGKRPVVSECQHTDSAPHLLLPYLTHCCLKRTTILDPCLPWTLSWYHTQGIQNTWLCQACLCSDTSRTIKLIQHHPTDPNSSIMFPFFSQNFLLFMTVKGCYWLSWTPHRAQPPFAMF